MNKIFDLLMLFLIFVLNMSIASKLNEFHAKIGEYPGIHLGTCGYSRRSAVLEESCFKWHDNVIKTRIVGGRDAKVGEFPWNVLLSCGYLCGGTVINKKWIITAGHCVRGRSPERCEVNVGLIKLPNRDENNDSYEIEKFVVHPNFHEEHNKSWDYDIGLVKLKKQIFINYTYDYFITNGICLPKKFIINDKYEWATLSGFGVKGQQYVDRLQTTDIKIWPFKESTYDPNGLLIDSNHYAYEPSGCAGDSGSGLVQYVKGRAVIIGVYTGRTPSYAACGRVEYKMRFERVSKFINWIIDTIKRN